MYTLAVSVILFITQDELGMTALSAACQQGHVNIVRLLINNGANVDFQHKVNKWLVIGATRTLIIFAPLIQDGRTGLMWASDNGHINVVKVLLDAKADPNIANEVKFYILFVDIAV